jgi:hypothetical protein
MRRLIVLCEKVVMRQRLSQKISFTDDDEIGIQVGGFNPTEQHFQSVNGVGERLIGVKST